MTQLDGKRVLITGGAQGIGLEMALKFAGRRADIIVADLNEAKLGQARAKIEETGVAAWAFPVDVTNPASIASLRSQIASEVGPVDILVNNAGVVFGGPFTETPLDRHFKTYEVNVLGVVAMTHAFLPDLIERPEAHLVNISSASGFVGLPFGSTYASSKWAVIGFSESIPSSCFPHAIPTLGVMWNVQSGSSGAIACACPEVKPAQSASAIAKARTRPLVGLRLPAQEFPDRS